jgi:LAO/AO transport system kinase
MKLSSERDIAKALTVVERGGDPARGILKEIFPETGRAHVIGVTGSPGAGKSSLVDRLAVELTNRGNKVGILAIDPSSPFTGGAVLGDRIRMFNALEMNGVFVRSMASRGSLGGLAPHAADAVFVLDAAGFSHIIVETVGVGQGEVEIVKAADSVVVVLVPGMGDTVQALKAGILEIADIFCINKSDVPGADRLQKELRTVMSLGPTNQRQPEIVQTTATENRGTPELVDAILRHQKEIEGSGELETRRRKFLFQTLQRVIAERCLAKAISRAEATGVMAEIVQRLYSRNEDPESLADEILSLT